MAIIDSIMLDRSFNPILLRDLRLSDIPSTAGVYCLRNRRSGNFYIGSSTNIRRRLIAHHSQLRRGTHCSQRMQWAWRNDGEAVIEAFVIEVVPDLAILHDREQHFISTFKPQYNFALTVDRPLLGRKLSLETIEKIRKSRKGKGLGPRKFSPAHIEALKAAAHREPIPQRRGEKRRASTRLKMSKSAIRKFSSGFVNGRTRRVEIGGVIYKSGKDAAVAIGVRPMQIVRAIRRGQGRYLDNP